MNQNPLELRKGLKITIFYLFNKCHIQFSSYTIASLYYYCANQLIHELFSNLKPTKMCRSVCIVHGRFHVISKFR